MTKARAFDYIIIGSGSAGSTLAGRLSEDPGTSVLLIEAGPRDKSIYIQMPAALGVPLTSDRFNWDYHSEPDPHVENRRIYEARGRVLGGSSSINGMNWVRGNPWDYDNWASQGLKGWALCGLPALFQAGGELRQGRQSLSRRLRPDEDRNLPGRGRIVSRRFSTPASQAGHGRVEDHNAFSQEGMHVTQRNVHKGIRWSTSRAYIQEAGPRSNLTVLTDTRVTGIELSNKRAVRLQCRTKSGPAQLRGGARTGDRRGDAELPAASDAVGHRGWRCAEAALHPGPGPSAGGGPQSDGSRSPPRSSMWRRAMPLWRESSGPLGRIKIAAQWLLFKNGIGTTNFFETGAFIRTDETIKIPNLQYEFIPVVGDFQFGSLALTKGFQYFFALMRPTSRGRVWIDSADPMAAPKFVFNYLSTEEDRRDAVAAVKTTRHIIAQSAWNKCRDREVTPGPDVTSDEEILAHLRRTVGTQYHPCGTCRMGHDPLSVVDELGRVHETDNLRIVDASIMPNIVTGNLNAPVIMMAEKLSDSLRGLPALPAEPAPYQRY